MKLADQLLEATDPAVSLVLKHFRDLFPEPSWYSGGCANLAFAFHLWLRQRGVSSRLQADQQADHFWVQIGRQRYEGGRYPVHGHLRAGLDLTDRVDAYVQDPAQFVREYQVRFNPRAFRAIWTTMNGAQRRYDRGWLGH